MKITKEEYLILKKAQQVLIHKFGYGSISINNLLSDFDLIQMGLKKSEIVRD